MSGLKSTFISYALLCISLIVFSDAAHSLEANSANYEKDLAILIKGKRWKEAENFLLLRIDDNKFDFDSIFQLARVYSWSGNHSESEKYYLYLIDRFPANLDYQLGLAHNQLWSRHFTEAIALARSVLKTLEANTDAWDVLIHGQIASGDLAGAAQSIRKASKVAPKQGFSKLLNHRAATTRPVDSWLSETKRQIALEHWVNADRLLTEHLRNHPADSDARFLYARVLAWRGSHDAAKTQYRYLLDKNPRSVDFILGIANLEAWEGHFDNALEWCNQVLAVSPETDEIRSTCRNFKIWKQSREIHDRIKASPVRINDPLISTNSSMLSGNYSSVPMPQGQSDRIEFGGSYEYLSKGYAPWSSSYVRYGQSGADGWQWQAMAAELNRFGLTDANIQLDMTKRLSPSWIVGIQTDDSPTNKFIPIWSLRGTLAYRTDFGLGIEAAYKYAAYRDVILNIGSFTLDQYIDSWRIAYTGFVSNLETYDTIAYSNLLDVSYFYGDKNRMGLLLGYGMQAVLKNAMLNPSDITLAMTQTYIVRGEYYFEDNLAMIYSLGYNVQGTFYSRSGFDLALRYAF